MKRHHYIAVYGIAILLVGLGVWKVAVPDDAPSVEAPSHVAQELVRVEITDEPVISRGQDPVIVQLESGVIPDDVTHLRVQFDGQCQADDDGVSHCMNPVEFDTADGVGTAILRHHHRFSEEPCLMPGTTLELVN